MIVKQLKKLCVVKDCFLFEGHVYEKLSSLPHDKDKEGYRILFSDDDYDYVENPKLIRKLDKFVKKLRNE